MPARFTLRRASRCAVTLDKKKQATNYQLRAW